MKRIITTTAIVVLMAVAALAQSASLNVSQAFTHYGKARGCTEIIVTGKKARSIGLDRYHSLETPAAYAASIAAMVTRDGATAADRETEYRGGQLYFGFYKLRRAGGANRYVFFLNQALARTRKADRVTLIYMEGPATKEQVRKLISQ